MGYCVDCVLSVYAFLFAPFTMRIVSSKQGRHKTYLGHEGDQMGHICRESEVINSRRIYSRMGSGALRALNDKFDRSFIDIEYIHTYTQEHGMWIAQTSKYTNSERLVFVALANSHLLLCGAQLLSERMKNVSSFGDKE